MAMAIDDFEAHMAASDFVRFGIQLCNRAIAKWRSRVIILDACQQFTR